LLENINLAEVKVFTVVVETGSFTKAAEVLLCSRSHISKQLTQLEADLGVALLIRTTRSQKLTEQGSVFYESCKKSLQGINHAIEDILVSSQLLQGQLNISCVGGYIGENLVADLIYKFMACYPDIRINLDFSSPRVDLISGAFDAVFRMGKLEDSALIARKLMDISVDTLASPEYLRLHGKPNTPKELIHHRCITGSVKHWSFIAKGSIDKKIEVPIKGHLSCKNGRVMINSALAHHGIIRVPHLYCQNEMATGKLVPVFDHWQVSATPFYLIYLQNKYQSLRLKYFIDFIIKEFSAKASSVKENLC